MQNPGTEPARITLPQIRSVKFENFDLYSREPNASVEIDDGVFCLIGANGLGKSTFLNAVNFAITGAVPDPKRNFVSAAEYWKNVSRTDRSADYFGGRIGELSRGIASVSVVLEWPDTTLDLKRELFGSQGILHLVRTNGTGASVQLGATDDGPEGLDRIYQAEVLRLSNLSDFAQFAFVFHFMVTFDEGRHLLTWDNDALTNALYLAFGADPVAARRADQLQHEMEREDSRARNIRFAARSASDRIQQLREILEDDHAPAPAAIEAEATFKQLTEQIEANEAKLNQKQTELRDADLAWTQLSARLTELQLEYRRLFSSRVSGLDVTRYHPAVAATISEDKCAVCGTGHVARAVQRKLDEHHCPLCESTIDGAAADQSVLEQLRAIDQQMASDRQELTAVLHARERLTAEMQAAAQSHQGSLAALKDFSSAEEELLSRIDVSNSLGAVQSELKRLEQERQSFISQAELHRKARDRLREELASLEADLKRKYDASAESFVPRFRELAEAFIGLPVDIQLEPVRGASRSGFWLHFRLDNQPRLRPDQLSESQRFFIDIALRMALAEQLSAERATLIVDTPEGSLDIAYEARAGVMFHKFVAEGHTLIMTANLRSSQLVLRLAELCGRKLMKVVRMTAWTDLTDVQLAEDKLFQDAYGAIEAALG